MAIKGRTFSLNTRGNADVVDITDQVALCLQDADLENGIVTIFCPSSTSALTTIEYEPGVVSDLKRLFDEIISPNRNYAHDAAWHDGNGHSHVRAALLGPSLTVPFARKRLTLGTWQQIVYIDFDIRPRRRALIVKILGD